MRSRSLQVLGNGGMWKYMSFAPFAVGQAAGLTMKTTAASVALNAGRQSMTMAQTITVIGISRTTSMVITNY